METLNVCIATYGLVKGNGIDISVLQFARELAKRHNVTLAFDYSDMDLHDLNILQCSNVFSAASELKRRKFDLISSHFPPFDIIATLSGIPHYLHDPGIPPLGVSKGLKDALFWAKINTARLYSARRSSCVLPISSYLGGEFKRKYRYRGPMEVLPYGIEFPVEEPRSTPPFGKYALFVGRHTYYKHVDRLMRIFADARKEVPDAHLVTIGNGVGPYMDLLSQKASNIGNVHMLGYVPDVWEYYANASVYVTCSAWEGQDRPAIEAQYMGKPVIALDNCSHKETVIHGTLADSDEAFKDALIKYLTTDFTDRAVRNRIKERYSTERMAERFMEIVKCKEKTT